MADEDSYGVASLKEDVASAKAQGLKGVLVHLGASWCRPCQRVKPVWRAHEPILAKNYIVRHTDIDESLELFSTLKKARVITGVPASLLYTQMGDTSTVAGLQPQDSCLSGDPIAAGEMSARLLNKA